MHTQRLTRVSSLLILLGITGFMIQAGLVSAGATASLVGINGAACAYSTIEDAISAASNGDTLYISPGIYSENPGEIFVSLTLQSAKAGSDCQTEDSSGDPTLVIIDGGFTGEDQTGGIFELAFGADVTFKHLSIRNGNVDGNGGNIAVGGGSTLTLDGSFVYGGDASDGGNIFAIGVNGGGDATINIINGSRIYDGSAINGAGIYIRNGTVSVANGSIGHGATNFNDAIGRGGGIYAKDATVELTSSLSKISYNEATSEGGGIYAEDSDVLISGGTITHNEVSNSDGAAIMAKRVASTSGLNFVLNNATLNSNEYQDSGIGSQVQVALFTIVEVDNTTITDGRGSGLHTTGGFVSIDGSHFINNRNAFGGLAVFAFEPTLFTMDNSVVSGNVTDQQLFTSTDGGAVKVVGESQFTQIRISDSQFLSNTAENYGGGLHLDIGNVTLNNNHFEGNSARRGAAIYATDVLLAISGSQVISNSGIYGIGLYLEEADATLDDTHFEHNSGQFGGAIYAEASELVITNSDVISNSAKVGGGRGGGSRSGGGLYIDGTNATLGNNHFERNSADYGAAIHARASELSIIDTHIISNAAKYNGGGLDTVSVNGIDTSLTINNSQFEGNSAEGNGGGINLTGSALTATNTRLISNTASSSGGGIYVASSSLVMSQDATCNLTALARDHYCSEIRGNSSSGIFLTSGSLTIKRTAFIDNLSAIGGAINSASNESHVDLTNVLITGHSGLGAIHVGSGGHLTLKSSTLADNDTVPLRMVSGAALTATNNIMWGNSSGPLLSSESLTGNCNNAQPNPVSTQTLPGISVDPQFEATARSAYFLASGSPSIDACTDGEAVDMIGESRPKGLRYDMGAFEMPAAPTKVGVSAQSIGGEFQAPVIFSVLLLVLMTGFCFHLRKRTFQM